MRRILFAATAALTLWTAPLAAADVWTLFSHKFWTVTYAERDGGPQCRAGVYDPGNEIAFSITFDEYGLDGNFYLSDHDFASKDGQVLVWVDRRKAWQIDASSEGPHIWFDLYDRRVLEQIEQGQRLHLDYNGDGQWDYWFSLQGSRAAIGAFAECVRRMS